MHFVNAQYGKENTNVKKIITFVRDVNNFILNELDIKPDEDSLFYHRYMTHLNFLHSELPAAFIILMTMILNCHY